MTVSLLNRVQGCLLGAQIGDAMGMPWEGMSALEIVNKTVVTSIAGVTGFEAPGAHSIKPVRHLKAGDTTDDWALTAANARALIHAHGFDARTVMTEHLVAHDASTVGWGGTTKRAMQAFKRFVETNGREGRNPATPAPPPDNPNAGCGNGVAMKIAPFAIAHVLKYGGANRLEELIQTVFRVGRMTHPDPLASVAASGIALMVARFLASPAHTLHADNMNPPFDVLDEVRSLLVACEQELASPEHAPGKTFSGQLKLILDYPEDLLNARDPQITAGDVAHVLGNGYHALESCAFAIAMALRHSDDFESAVLETVNCGGDADTNASMVGAIVGARVGLDGIPGEWRTFSPAFQESLDLGTQLFNTRWR